MKNTELVFDELHLTEMQKHIVMSNKYPQYIKAGAGTGKTETLIQKIIFILENEPNTSLNNICIISFTNKATDEMKTRLSNGLYKKSLMYLNKENQELYRKLRDDAYLVNISSVTTIHAFCERLLREYGLAIGLSPNFKKASYLNKVNEEASSIIRHLYENNEITDIQENTLRGLVYDVYCKNNDKGIYEVNNTYNLIDTKLGKLRRKFIDIYNQVIKSIEVYKHDENVLSLNDSLEKTVSLLKNDFVRKKVKQQFKYIFIDEYQDTNIPQFKLTKELIDIGINVFLVGDEKQAIYGFRGADINNSRNMSEHIKGFNNDSILLTENFRSDPELIKIINKMFSKDISYRGEKIKFNDEPLQIPNFNRKSESDPVQITYGTDIIKVVKNIVENMTLRGKPISYSDISILCRKNYMVDNIAEKCKQAHIPVEVMGGHGFYKAKEIIDIYKFLNYVVYKREIYRNELLLTDAYKAFIISGSGNFDVFIDELCDYSKNNSIELIIDFIIEKTNLDSFYMNNNRYQAISNLSKLKSMAYNTKKSTFMPALSFLEFISLKISTGAEEDEAPISDENRKKGVISVYTVHKAKGLSFPVVIISDMDNSLINPKQFPKAIMKCKDGKTAIGFSEKVIAKQDIQYTKLLDQYIIEMLEEELRILYVACTRAKHMLVFSCNRSKDSVLSNPNSVSWAKWIIEK